MVDAVVPTYEAPAYPVWQNKIRDVQDQYVQRQKKAEAIEAGVRQEIDLADGRMLAEALAYFGLDAAPEKNHFEVDGLWFELSSHPGTPLVKRDGERIEFAIHVGYVLADKYHRHMDEWAFVNYVSVKKAKGDDPSEAFVRLADAIDDVSLRARQHIEWVDALEQKSAESVPPSTADQLVALIRQIVREEADADRPYSIDP